PGDLAGVRSELKRLGYLSHGFERYLLQDALRPQRPWRTLLDLTAKVSLLGGAGLALVLSFALCAANGSLTATPLDLLALFLHLFPPIAILAAAGFLALCGVVILVLKLYHVRRIETLALAAAVAAGAAALGLALFRGRDLVAGSPRWQLAVVAVAAPAAVYLLIKLIYHGLLALAIRLTDAPPDRRLFSRRGLGFGILSAAFLLTLPAVLAAARGERVETPPSLPEAPGDRVLLLGIDGVLPAEADYLLKTGDLPALARLAGESGGARAYVRGPEPPASFWASVATGLPTPEHGVASLDSFRPLLVSTPLARTGALRAYWSRIEVPLHLAEYRPVLANRRSAFTVWELAARGGAPVLAVNWWATFPAAPLPGLVIAHGGYQLLHEGAEGAVAPAAARPALAAAAHAVASQAREVDPRLGAALTAADRQALLDRALLPDRFYRQAFERGLLSRPRAAALYLPGLDIAADGFRGSGLAFADLLRAELAAADGLLGRALGSEGGIGTIVVVLDPGRRSRGGEGRVILWRRAGCPGAGTAPGGRFTIESAASALLRAAGLPQSAELPEPPDGCPWPAPPAVLPGYGRPTTAKAPAEAGGEYLENLRSLGYL
ncbi:MAG: Type phosphodiesterase / nucleotide pyrophosphatase, partial [Acidobacteriota bacterium]|nr:Type phosphodiesterase / nucleotide pyrophosphatase [Acidobacteriota bacterium]